MSLLDGSVDYLLIENKVSAGMQPRQAERYRERGEVYVAEGECAAFTTVLIAPRAYLTPAGVMRSFDAAVSKIGLGAYVVGRTAEKVLPGLVDSLKRN